MKRSEKTTLPTMDFGCIMRILPFQRGLFIGENKFQYLLEYTLIHIRVYVLHCHIGISTTPTQYKNQCMCALLLRLYSLMGRVTRFFIFILFSFFYDTGQ